MLTNQQSYSLFLKGVSSYEKAQYQQAISQFRQSVKPQMYLPNNQQPKNSHSINSSISLQTLSNLSSCYIKMKQYQEAIRICEQAIKLDPYFSVPYYHIASAFIRQQKYLQAIRSIKCAISCQYLKKYEKFYDKQCLDKAIIFASNNIQAIKYRISLNFQTLRQIKAKFSPNQTVQEVQRTLKQLEQDIKQQDKFLTIYDIKFIREQKYCQNVNPNYYLITSQRPHFILQSSYYICEESQPRTMEKKLKLMTQLKNLRCFYIELLSQNNKKVQLQNFIQEFKFGFYFALQKDNKSQEMQSDHIAYMNELSINNQRPVQNSFELEDLTEPLRKPLQSLSPHHNQETRIKIKTKKILQPQNNSKKQLNRRKSQTNKQNIKRQTNNNVLNVKKNLKEKDSKQNILKLSKYKDTNYINQASEEEELKTSRNNQTESQQNRNKTEQEPLFQYKENLNSSIISILDYEDCSSNLNVAEGHCHQPKMIESIMVHPPIHRQNCCSHQESETGHSWIGLVKNRSHENLLTSKLLASSTKNLSVSRYDKDSNDKSMISSKSHFKLLSCSKCSIDHSNEQNMPKNVKININLTQIYNYPGDYSQLKTFCVVRHLDQQYRTQQSKGKFPNWKQNIELRVQNLQQINNSSEEQREIRIQLWAKGSSLKNEASFRNCLQGKQLVGQCVIDLDEQKWVKRKIVLHKIESGHQKKTAYMYVSLQKIKN